MKGWGVFCALSVGGALIRQRLEQFRHQYVLFGMMPQWQLGINPIDVSTSALTALYIPCFFQVRDYFVGCALSDTNVIGDLPCRASRIMDDVAKD